MLLHSSSLHEGREGKRLLRSVLRREGPVKFAESGSSRPPGEVEECAEGLLDRLLSTLSPDETVIRGWHKMVVEKVSTTEFTRITDKLPSISGLAALFKPVLGRYLAGHWERHLLSTLCWKLGNSGRRTETDPPYIAPSWSWASMDGPVLSHVASSQAVYVAEVQEAVVALANSDLVTPDEFGAVAAEGSMLRLRGPLHALVLSSNAGWQGDWCCPRHGSFRTPCLFGVPVAVHIDLDHQRDRRFFPGGGSYDSAGPTAAEPADVLFMLPLFIDDGRCHGLMLRRASRGADTYRRFGVFASEKLPDSTLQGSTAFSENSRQELVII